MRMEKQLWKQESRENSEDKGAGRVARSEVQEQWREQTSIQSCENKGPVKTRVQEQLWEQGSSNSCEQKSPGRFMRTRVQGEG